MITYKITSERNDDNGIKITTIEFDYKNETHQVDVPHFRPTTLEEIEIGIINRINSEISAIDASEVSSALSVELNVDKDAVLLNSIVSEDLTYVNYTIEELNQKLALLSEGYNQIQNRIMQAQSDLSANSADYDLVIAELLKRGV